MMIQVGNFDYWLGRLLMIDGIWDTGYQMPEKI
jgi:hypothetical protein